MVGSTFFGLDLSQLGTRWLSIRRRISKRVLVLEFGPNYLLLAEATLTTSGVKLNHVSSFALPPQALDRGVPSEPLNMAALIQQFCAEKKIPARRAAVVLPPDLAFQRLLHLPSNLTIDEAREYVLNPANGLQIPFPLTQTDFDLFPVTTPADQQYSDDNQLYMLTAIPEVLVDPIVEMLQAADLELQLLELGSYSQLRNYAADLVTLAPKQVDLILELLPEFSNLIFASSSGLLGSERLAAIRNLPEIEIDSEQLMIAYESGLTAEKLVLKDENYLPISELDLRVLIADLWASFESFHRNIPGAQIRRLILTGVNSSHPLLANLLQETFGLPVVLSRTSDITVLEGLSIVDLLLESSLGRLTGLALGLLTKDQLFSCSLVGLGLKNKDTYIQNDVVEIADLLSAAEGCVDQDRDLLEVRPSSVANEVQGNDAEIVLDLDEYVSVNSTASMNSEVNLSIEGPEQSLPLLPSPKDTTSDEELTSSLENLSDVRNTTSDESSDQFLSESPHDINYLPPNSIENDPNFGNEILESDQKLNFQKDFSPAGTDFDHAISVNDASESSSLDEIWPSINDANQVNQSTHEQLHSDEDVTAWPSISFDRNSDLVDSTAESDNPSDTIFSEYDNTEHGDATQITESTSLGLSSETRENSDGAPDPTAQPVEMKPGLDGDHNIPDLNLTTKPDENLDELSDESPEKDKPGLCDHSLELGELRFANEE